MWRSARGGRALEHVLAKLGRDHEELRGAGGRSRLRDLVKHLPT
jgi:hypothetical protein